MSPASCSRLIVLYRFARCPTLTTWSLPQCLIRRWIPYGCSGPGTSMLSTATASGDGRYDGSTMPSLVARQLVTRELVAARLRNRLGLRDHSHNDLYSV